MLALCTYRGSPLILLLVLCACSDARIARTALLGTTKLELTMCAGQPSAAETINRRETIEFYKFEAGSPGVNLSLPIVGGVSFSSKQSCTAMFRMIDGKVAELRYTGPTRSSLFDRDGACEPIVLHCLEDPEHIPSPIAK